MDGARLFNACVAAGYSPADFARKADTVNVCFSKGLGAPVGSAMIGSAKLVERARRFRKMFGGGMRQSGVLAAAAVPQGPIVMPGKPTPPKDCVVFLRQQGIGDAVPCFPSER